MTAGDKVALANRWYEVACAQDESIVMDVYNGSSADGANVQLWSRNENASQCFNVVPDAAGGYKVYVGTGTNKIFDCKGYYTSANLKNGVNLQVWHPDGTPTPADQRWHFEDSGKGTLDVNGVGYQLLNVVSERDGNFVVDASGYNAYVGDNAQLWSRNGGLNQCFALVPVVRAATRQVSAVSSVSAYADGATPSDSSANVLPTDGDALAVRPCCKDPYYDMQLRYRVTDADGAVGQWRSCVDGDAGAHGWGFKTVRADKSGEWHVFPALDAVTVPAGGSVEFGIRPCDATDTTESSPAGTVGEAKWHHYQASCAVAVRRRPVATVDSVTWTPMGLNVTVTVADGDNCSGVVEVPSLGFSQAYSGEGGTFSVMGPVSTIPADGQLVGVTGGVTTGHGLTCGVDASKAVSLTDVGGSLSVTPHRVSQSAWTVARPTTYDDMRAWCVIGGVAHECRADANGTFWVPAPQVGYRITVCALKAGKWATWSKAYPASDRSEFAFTWEGGSDGVWLAEGGNPKLSWSESANVDADLTTARSYELVSVGVGRKHSGTVAGAWLTEDAASAEDRATRLLDARFAWLATPRGSLWRVAVEGVSVEQQHPMWSDVTVSVRRVDG